VVHESSYEYYYDGMLEAVKIQNYIFKINKNYFFST
jgi:hypothetical protein